jgi:hypothetical protein
VAGKIVLRPLKDGAIAWSTSPAVIIRPEDDSQGAEHLPAGELARVIAIELQQGHRQASATSSDATGHQRASFIGRMHISGCKTCASLS